MVVWIIGLSGAGKTTLAKRVVKDLRLSGTSVALIDGDMIRETFGNDLGHSISDRQKNAERISRLCKFLDNQDIHVVCAILSLFPESCSWNRKNINNYYEVYIEANMDQLQKIEYKGLYKKFNEGQIKNIAGLDIEFIPPNNSELIIKNNQSLNHLLKHSKYITKVIKDSVQ